LPRLLQVPDAEVADADGTDLAGDVQLFQRLHRLFQRYQVKDARPVDLVEVDRVDVEPLQAQLARLDHLVVPEVGPRHLCRDDHLVTPDFLQRPPHDLLGVPVAVDLGGVDEVDAERARLDDGGYAVLVLDILAPLLPAGLPRPDPNARYLDARPAESDLLHGTPQASMAGRCMRFASRRTQIHSRMEGLGRVPWLVPFAKSINIAVIYSITR